MLIKSRDVTMRVVDEIKMSPDEWDSRNSGPVVWREHMTKILNLRVTKLAPQHNAVDFYNSLLRFAGEIGFGEERAIAKVTEHVYNVRLVFADQAA